MVSLVVTAGNSSLSKYSQEIGKRLKVEKIMTGRPDTARWPVSLREGYFFIRLLQKHKKKILHLPYQHLARYAVFQKAPFIITVHDLFRICISTNEPVGERICLKLDKLGLKKARRIIAVSKSTKNDIIKYLQIGEEKISIIYLGVDPSIFYPCKSNSYDFRYILFVGSERKRKNLDVLLKAFRELKNDGRFKDLKLIKVGGPGRSEKYRQRTLEVINRLDLHKDIIFTEFIPKQELAVYYSNAACFVIPSLYEGFGWPPLEAMACGCPVIASNTSSLPEVVGDAGILVEPNDVPGFVGAMREVLTNSSLRENMVGRGLEQAKKFSWEETVRQTMEVHQEVA